MAYSLRLKLATLTFKALHTGRLPYLSDLATSRTHEAEMGSNLVTVI